MANCSALSQHGSINQLSFEEKLSSSWLLLETRGVSIG
jgi:hypothetical protein